MVNQLARLGAEAIGVPPDGISEAAVDAPSLEPFLNGAGEQVDAFSQRIDGWWERTKEAKASEHYYYFQPVDSLEGPWVHTEGKRKLMFATYSYLGLINHPRIVAAAKDAADKYGTGTHGVRILGGTLDLHTKMERTIADFARREEAIVYSSGYVTNLATVSTVVGRGDWVFSDRWNHASIVDGCLLARGKFVRFRHNDMDDLERQLRRAPEEAGKLVIADAVFSMDGDIFNLPDAHEICRRYNARLMLDEAHSIGVLGKTGHGIEEHFNMYGSIDLKMGTLSKAVPGIGGYVAGSDKLVTYLRHTARGFVFSAALPPAVAAAITEGFHVIEDEGAERNRILLRNAQQFTSGLQAAGFDTGQTESPIVPIMVGTEERAFAMTKFCQDNGIFVLPVLPPAVKEGTARLRANVTAAHTEEDIEFALSVFIKAGRHIGVID